MMKIESISQRELVEAYLKAHYSRNADVLVIWMDSIDSAQEWESLLKYLDGLGVKPPVAFRSILDGVIIIEGLPDGVIKNVINVFDKAGIRLEQYDNGECVHENR